MYPFNSMLITNQRRLEKFNTFRDSNGYWLCHCWPSPSETKRYRNRSIYFVLSEQLRINPAGKFLFYCHQGRD
ncbi:hypothetical protein sphantq_04320 [Sphingobium sp. AntQ-1]|nr:hypothetical protein sphantq_04320 [Sphingobium sp. AntQ-1]